MSLYWKMWEKIKSVPLEQRLWFLSEHPRAEGKDLDFFGETYFDVDLLEAVRNSVNDDYKIGD